MADADETTEDSHDDDDDNNDDDDDNDDNDDNDDDGDDDDGNDIESNGMIVSGCNVSEEYGDVSDRSTSSQPQPTPVSEIGEEPVAKKDSYDFHRVLNEALSRGNSVPIDVLKIVTLGPPAAGKTQLKKGLLGNFDPSDHSTPMSTRPTVVVERYVQNESKWVEFTLEKSKQQLNRWVSSRSTSPGESMGSNNPNIRSPRKQDPKSKNLENFATRTVGSMAEMRNRAKAFRSAKEEILKQLAEICGPNRPSDEIPQHKLRMMSIIDSGGQPTFYDVHPVLASSRAVYLQVFNLAEGILRIPRMTYRKKSAETKEIPNSFTNADIIARSLITLSECKKKFEKMDGLISEVVEKKSIDLPIMLIGTHSDQCTNPSQTAVEASCEIEKSCKHLEIFKEEVLCDSENCVFPVNCFEALDNVRKRINDSLGGYTIHLPLNWFFCHLILWSIIDDNPVMKFSDLLSFCQDSGVLQSKEELYTMVKLFHILGLFVFPDIDKELEFDEISPHDFPVFLNPDFLYQKITSILDIQFMVDVSGSRKKLQREGMLSVETLEDIGIPDEVNGFSDFRRWLIGCLIRWGLAASLKDVDGRYFYFVPSVLPPAPPEKHHEKPDERDLLVSVRSGQGRSYNMPMGLFPHLVAYLVRKKGYRPSNTSSRNVVIFSNISQDKQSLSLTLRDFAEYFSVSLVPENPKEALKSKIFQSFTSYIQGAVCETWKKIYHNDPEIVVGFLCPCGRVSRYHVADYSEESTGGTCLAWEEDFGRIVKFNKEQKKWLQKKKVGTASSKPDTASRKFKDCRFSEPTRLEVPVQETQPYGKELELCIPTSIAPEPSLLTHCPTQCSDSGLELSLLPHNIARRDTVLLPLSHEESANYPASELTAMIPGTQSMVSSDSGFLSACSDETAEGQSSSQTASLRGQVGSKRSSTSSDTPSPKRLLASPEASVSSDLDKVYAHQCENQSTSTDVSLTHSSSNPTPISVSKPSNVSETPDIKDVLDKVPSDIGLQGILTKCPRWRGYAISLGLSIDQIKTYSEEPGELKGLLALKHWRDGRCSSDFPTTWKFLLEVISDCAGTKVADDLEKRICEKRTWSC